MPPLTPNEPQFSRRVQPVISDRAMLALRCAAAVAHVVPQLSVQLCSRGEVIGVVGRPPHGNDGTLAMSACAFRAAVARALPRFDAGEKLGFVGLPPCADIQVHLGVPLGNELLAGGIVRTAIADRLVHVVPLPVAAQACRAELQESPGIGLYDDEALRVTILHTDTQYGDLPAAHGALQSLEVALARCAVVTIDAELQQLSEV